MSGGLHSRPDKLDDAETMFYEIDMLRFSKERLSGTFQSEKDEWMCLETFLLHYRNLIEFFKGKVSRTDTLSIAEPKTFWPHKSPAQGELDSLSRPDLWDKYEGKLDDKISKYLQHCTKQRVIKKKWNVTAMYEDLRPVIEKFETLLPEYKPVKSPVATGQLIPVTATLGQDAKSTSSTRAPDLTSSTAGSYMGGVLDAVMEVSRQEAKILGEMRDALKRGDHSKALEKAREICGLKTNP